MNRSVKLCTLLLALSTLILCGCGGFSSRNVPLPAGLSNPTPTPTPGSGLSITVLAQSANDIVWDAAHSRLYASVGDGADANADSIIAIDPSQAEVTDVRAIGGGSDPSALAISSDGAFLYVGLNGLSSVQRLTLPALEPDITYNLGVDDTCGPRYAVDLQVAPGATSTTAVNFGCSGFAAPSTGIAIFDNDVARAATALSSQSPAGSIQWGADAHTLYAANNETTGSEFYVLGVDNSGATVTHTYQSVFSQLGLRIHYDAGSIYSDDGKVINPASGQAVASFGASGLMVPDSGLGKAFFLGLATNTDGDRQAAVESFGLSNQSPISLAFLPNVTGTPIRLIRWGSDGLVFLTDDGQIHVMHGVLVAESSSAAQGPPPAELVHAGWTNRAQHK